MTNAHPTVTVKLSAKARPGLRACGNYRVDQEYKVALDEAVHLVSNKGFAAASAADKKAVNAAIAAADKAAQEAATAAPETQE